MNWPLHILSFSGNHLGLSNSVKSYLSVGKIHLNSISLIEFPAEDFACKLIKDHLLQDPF